jgi:hypothetical protein
MAFPSMEHRAALQTQRKKSGPLEGLDREHYHAYDYGWRRVVLDDFSRTSAMDGDGESYRPDLADQTEAMWRRKFHRPKRVREFEPRAGAGDAERAAWEEGRRHLDALKARIPGNGTNGRPSPEAIAFVEACLAFRERMTEFLPMRGAGPLKAAIDAILVEQQAAGLRVTPHDGAVTDPRGGA